MEAQRSVNDALRARMARAAALTQAAAAPRTVEEALQSMFAAADVVFTGEVVAVEHDEDVVTVRFAVEDGVRGVSTSAGYTLREWSGLWSDNPSRYTVGQHLLMLLHAPSVAGFASPVSDGAIPLTGDAATGTADLRWIASQVAVTDEARLRPVAALRAAGGSLTGADALMRAEAMQHAMAQNAAKARALLRGAADPQPLESDNSAAATGGDANARADRTVVMDMLHAWQQRSERAQ